MSVNIQYANCQLKGVFSDSGGEKEPVEGEQTKTSFNKNDDFIIKTETSAHTPTPTITHAQSKSHTQYWDECTHLHKHTL